MRPAGERTVASQRSAQTPHPPSGPLVPGAMTTQKYFTLGAGPEFCGSVNSGRSSNAMSFRACSPHTHSFPYTSRGISKQRGGPLLKGLGSFLCAANTECTYCFPALSQWGPPKPLLRNDGFTPLSTFWWLQANHQWWKKCSEYLFKTSSQCHTHVPHLKYLQQNTLKCKSYWPLSALHYNITESWFLRH